jgi:ubiquinone/menaquinone biosynthesis C-methylase UbiE
MGSRSGSRPGESRFASAFVLRPDMRIRGTSSTPGAFSYGPTAAFHSDGIWGLYIAEVSSRRSAGATQNEAPGQAPVGPCTSGCSRYESSFHRTAVRPKSLLNWPLHGGQPSPASARRGPKLADVSGSVVARSKQNIWHLSRRAGLKAPLEDRRQVLDAWLREREMEAGVALISPARAFADAEEDYDEFIGSGDTASAGRAIYELWSMVEGGPGGLALELGAGSGAVTRGFVQAAGGFTTLITDPSLQFLAMTKRKLTTLHSGAEGTVRYGTLLGEDLGHLPNDLFDIVFAQACLHHVTDWKQLLRDAKSILTPGGVFVFQEPFSEGTYFMGIAAEALMRANGVPDDDRARLEEMRQSIYLLSDRTINKDHGEDKHCFYTDDMIGTCHETFGNVRFLRNQSFDSIAAWTATSDVDLDYFSGRAGAVSSFLEYCRAFFTQHYGLSEKAMAEFDRVVAPQFEGLDALYRQGDGPAIRAVVLCRKSWSFRTNAERIQRFVARK